MNILDMDEYIETKPCTQCKVVKPRTSEFFGKRPIMSDGLKSQCRQCDRDYTNRKRAEDPADASRKNREWRKNNPEKTRKHYDKGKVRSREWYRKNSKRAIDYNIQYEKNRRENNPAFAMRKRMSHLMRQALKQQLLKKNNRSLEKLLGYSAEELVLHLESRFEEGMTWDNRDKWHIDHIISAQLFDLSDPKSEAFKACWSLRNLRPCWAKDNMKKTETSIGI